MTQQIGSPGTPGDSGADGWTWGTLRPSFWHEPLPDPRRLRGLSNLVSIATEVTRAGAGVAFEPTIEGLKAAILRLYRQLYRTIA